MADADAIREAGVPGPPVTPPPATPPAPGPPSPADPSSVTPAGDASVMSLVDHLSELRTRLFRALLAVVAGSAVGFYFAVPIRDLLTTPLPTHQLQVLGPGDAFVITLRIAIVFGVIVAMPVILWQAWGFVAPGLTPGERRIVRPFVLLSLFFFALGVVIAWVVLPFAMAFLLSFTDRSLVANLAAGPYFDFVTTMFLAFGLVMEFPILLYGLSRVGIVSSQMLRRYRRYVILGITIFAAVATPGGDLVSPFILGLTMYILFELTTIAIRRSGR